MLRSIAIVVPTLGERPKWLSDCVVSIQTQEVNADVRIIVVAPHSAGIEKVCEDLGVPLHRSDRRGLSAAINDGWSAASDADYLAWLGDDDLLAPGAFSAALEALEADESASGVYGDVRYIDSAGGTLWLQRPGRLSAMYLKYGKDLVSQPGALFRGSAVRSIGGVDETFKSAMDMDLFARLQDVGRLRYIPKEVGAFRLHESNITLTKGKGGRVEADVIRRRYAGRAHPLVRAVTKVLDRLIYAMIRRLPPREAPTVQGVPYVQVGS